MAKSKTAKSQAAIDESGSAWMETEHPGIAQGIRDDIAAGATLADFLEQLKVNFPEGVRSPFCVRYLQAARHYGAK